MNPLDEVRTTLEAVMRPVAHSLAVVAEAIGALIIAVAMIRGLIAYLRELVAAPDGAIPKEAIRLTLGRALALALEFLLAADILRTAVAPSWQEIGMLAAIAVIRTGLNYFLQRELESAARRDEAPKAGPLADGLRKPAPIRE